jgi:hypothetical protein
MRRDQAPDRNCATQGLGGDAQRQAAERADLKRGSHVTPVAPAAEPTDPFCSASPFARPPSWLPLDDAEPLLREAEPTGRAPNLELLEFYAESEAPRSRDTLPSPPPSPEESDSAIPPTIVDRRKE